MQLDWAIYIARRVVDLISLWRARARERRLLSELDDHSLRDIGLTRSMARWESSRLFWQGEERVSRDWTIADHPKRKAAPKRRLARAKESAN